MTAYNEISFLNEKPVKALVSIRRTREDIHVSVVARKIDTTHAHTVKIIRRLEEDGYITSRKMGRKKLLFLTEKGEQVADLFGEVLAEIGEGPQIVTA